ncbi:diaminopimelate epimerase [Paenibacillus koleovorans]|uniref:diaminopimelate epimerase n=1 Tax=Paenibacillus koleovorans TaxID=121608 RepID=UPI000FDA5FA5|nr:diaminopimelate epimerase [Paenibacillus koleovorans]
MNFTKMQGLGNDFIVIADRAELPADHAELAKRWCDRHFGIGADGVVYILPSEKADFSMRIINADGSEAEQCGNAIRCVAKYVFDRGLTEKRELTIETIGAGVQPVQLQVEAGHTVSVRVNMGEPILEGLRIPTTLDMNPVIDRPIYADGADFRFTAVSMGNPHSVIFVEDAPSFDLHRYGPLLEVHELFPKRVNVEFATVRSRDHVDMRVWERGAGPTLACGTGACATLVATVLNGKTDRTATVSLTGGDLLIEWAADNVIYMTGAAEFVFDGAV